jgi:hypothetical protein
MTNKITASLPLITPPTWAVLERELIDVMNRSVHTFLAKYTHADGPRQHELIWREELPGRDGADDFYESFYNWPLLYLLGGSDELLALGLRQWEATTRQLTRLGLVHKEYERGYDQFHQAESYIYFYLLCLADPTNPRLHELARRFAGFFLNEDPEAPNYDPEHNIIRAPHNGSGGPRWGMNDDGSPVSYEYSPGMAVYGLPYYDLPGIESAEDLKDPAIARRVGEAMERGMSRGDVAANLGVSPLIANAALLTGDPKYKEWLLRYVNGWIERAQANHGLLPDTVGLSGQVGEYLGGKWYGGLYGWTWPHGFYNLQHVALSAAQCCLLLTNDLGFLDLPRTQQDRIVALGVIRSLAELRGKMSLSHHWIGVNTAVEDEGENATTFVVPYRYGDKGWFDYQPMSPIYPAALWNMSMDADDWQRLVEIRDRSNYEWRTVYPFHTKEDAGHEQPWIEYMAGRNPTYPEDVLRESLGQVYWRLDRIRADFADLTEVYIHHWQERNPVTTEALIQLTLGAPQMLYNGGLLMTPIRYFDAERQRPGLPADVAALVTKIDGESISLTLVNLSAFSTRQVLIQAGSFGEHSFGEARYMGRSAESIYPFAEANYTYAASPYTQPDPMPTEYRQDIRDKHVQIELPPATEIHLTLSMQRYVNQASYALP